MRKHIRNILRAKAERMGVKPSRFVAAEFDKRQIQKYGETKRRVNQAKGTHKKSTWGNRIDIMV